MPSQRSSSPAEPLRFLPLCVRGFSPAAALLVAVVVLAAVPTWAQETPRNVIRWRNDRGRVEQLDVGPSLPRNATQAEQDDDGERTPDEKLQDQERQRLEAERDRLALEKEIAELERQIAEIDQQITELRSRQERQEYDEDDYESGLEYYMGLKIRRRADKRRLWRHYTDRYRRPDRRRAPKPEPRHRVQKKLR